MGSMAITARKAGRPSRAEAEQLDAMILDRALASFLAKGFARTTIEEIAEECETTRRSVVRRYPTKEALLIAAVGLFRSRSVTQGTPDDEDLPPLEALRQVCRRLFLHSISPTSVAFFRLCAAEVERTPTLGSFALAWDDENARAVQKRVLNAQSAGHFSRQSAASIATFVIGVMCSNPVNRTLLQDPFFADEHNLELYFSEMWTLVIAMG